MNGSIHFEELSDPVTFFGCCYTPGDYVSAIPVVIFYTSYNIQGKEKGGTSPNFDSILQMYNRYLNYFL